MLQLAPHVWTHFFLTIEYAWSAYTKGGPTAMPTEAIVDIHAGTIFGCTVVREWRTRMNDCGGGAAWSTEARVALADTGRRDHVRNEGPCSNARAINSVLKKIYVAIIMCTTHAYPVM